jgi:aminomethyltransferase
MEQLKRTAVFPAYEKAAGAKFVDFGGWELPVQFDEGIIAEHQQVRTSAGLFDVSHMGEIRITGNQAENLVQWLVTGDVQKLSRGEVLYSIMCNESGGSVDDLLVYKYSSTEFFLVVNAANSDKDFEWMKKQAQEQGFSEINIENESAQWFQLALQGPRAQEVLQKLVPVDCDLDQITFFTFQDNISIASTEVLISRTGYTGEDGFEIYGKSQDGPGLWNTILQDELCKPIGLGARDTLRFEAKLALYGHELSDEISPLEAGLKYFVDLDKSDFCGKKVLVDMFNEKSYPLLKGIRMIDKGVARQGYEVFNESGEKIGFITSGTKSPTKNEFLALAILNRENGEIGTKVFIQIGSKLKSAELVKTPFYKRTKKRVEK